MCMRITGLSRVRSVSYFIARAFLDRSGMGAIPWIGFRNSHFVSAMPVSHASETLEPQRITAENLYASWIEEGQIAVEGIRTTLGSYVWSTPIEFDLSISNHVLMFALSPLPQLHECSIHGMYADQPFRVGRLCWVPAHLPHRSRHSRSVVRFLMMHVNPEYFAELTGLRSEWDVKSGFDVTAMEIDGNLLRLARETLSPGFATNVLAEGLSLALMADMSRFLRNTVHHEKQVKRISQRQVRDITAYVESLRGASPTVTELAALAGISRRHLGRIFKQTTGQTLHDYVTTVRVRKAITLLCDTQMPIKQVAHELGFAALESFSVAFRSATGQTPTTFRRDFRAARTLSLPRVN
jgi:AraC family transcriptional regulator